MEKSENVLQEITDKILDFIAIGVLFDNIHLTEAKYHQLRQCVFVSNNFISDKKLELDYIQIHNCKLRIIVEKIKPIARVWFTQNLIYTQGVKNEPKIGRWDGTIEILANNVITCSDKPTICNGSAMPDMKYANEG